MATLDDMHRECYAGGKAIARAQERRAVTMYLRRFADGLETSVGPCKAELASSLRLLASLIADGQHAENQ